jgi:hypothetical protein
MERFREHFRGYEDSFVLIGGAACDQWMSDSGLRFRGTKDLDIVLVLEALDAAFVLRFWQFVEEGGYTTRLRQDTGKHEFFRFLHPSIPGVPAMLELFSRAPADLELGRNQTITPVPTDESVASLSAILMDDDYYTLILAARRTVDGVPMVGAAGLIPLKARAWLDMTSREAAGGKVDEGDVKKHRNDVFRLALTLSGQAAIEIGSNVHHDLERFLQAFPDDAPDWEGILQALRNSTPRPPKPDELLQTIRTFFRLA